MVKKATFLLSILILLFSMLALPAYAEDYSEIEDELYNFTDSIPSDIAELLPDGIFSDNLEDIREGIEEATSFEYFINLLFDWLGVNFKTVIKNIALIVSLLVVCSLIAILKNNLKSEATSRVLSLVGSIVIMSLILKIANEPIDRINLFLESTKTLVNTSTPLICSLYAMGGNVSGAIVQNFNLIAFLTVFQNVCILSLKIVLSLCMSLAASSAFLPNINLKPLADTVKKTFTFFVGILMLVFSFVMSTQTLLASKADSLTGKTAKLFAGQMIPLAGGTVGDSLKTAGASIEYLRSTVGIGIVIIFLLLVLPTIISVWSFRLTFIASNSIAGLLGCEKEGKTLAEIASIYGYVLAIISISSISLLYLLTLFARCTSALA